MVCNAEVAMTSLYADKIELQLAFDYNGQMAAAYCPLSMTTETVEAILKLTNNVVWEQVKGSFVRIKIEGEGDGMKLVGVGHIMSDMWITLQNEDVPQVDAEVVSE